METLRLLFYCYTYYSYLVLIVMFINFNVDISDVYVGNISVGKLRELKRRQDLGAVTENKWADYRVTKRIEETEGKQTNSIKLIWTMKGK